MIELSTSILWINLAFMAFALFIFLIFYLKGLMSSLYDFIVFGLIIISITPLSNWFAQQLPLFGSSQLQDGFVGVMASRYINQVIWGMIMYMLLSFIFFMIKRPVLKRLPIKPNAKLDKALSFIISGTLVFVVGTLTSSVLLSPVFSNGEDILNRSILVVFKSSAHDVIETIEEQLEDFNVLTKLITGAALTVEDQPALIELIVSFDVPPHVATTLSKFALNQAVDHEELTALLNYAQERGFTLDDLRSILRNLGLDEATINELLDIEP